MKSKTFVNYVENELLSYIDDTPLCRQQIMFYWNEFQLKGRDEYLDLLWTVIAFLIWKKVTINK